jgi:ABC-2 type transport system permease protein
MLQQLKTISHLWKASIIQSMEYRGSFVFSIVANFFDFVFGLLQYLLFFTAAKSIAGWSSDSMLLLYAVFMLIYSLQFIFLYPNIVALAEMVNTGGLDLLLTKPLNARLFVLLRKISLEELGSISTSLALFAWLWYKNALDLTPLNLLLFAISMACACSMVYSIYVILTATAIRLERMDDASDFIWSLFSLCRYPTEIYPAKLRFMFFTFMPVAFLSSVPAGILGGFYPQSTVFLGVAVALVLNIFSNIIWNKSIKGYTSAGG